MKLTTGYALKYSMAASFCLLLFFQACRKPQIEKKPAARALTSGVPSGVSIDLVDVAAKIPSTILHNIEDKVVLYAGRAQWKYKDEGLLVRIPITERNDRFIYAYKPYEDKKRTDIFAVQFTPDSTSTDTLFSGREVWVDFQNMTNYGIEYRKNVEVARMSTQQLLPVDWEEKSIEFGHFYIDANNQLQTIEDCGAAHSDASNAWNMVRDPLDCPNNPNATPGPGIFKNIFEFFTKVGGWLVGESNGSGGGGWNLGGGGGYWFPTGNNGGLEPGGGGGGSWGGNAGGDPEPGGPLTIKGNGISGVSVKTNELTDEHGFLISRKLELQLYLQANPEKMLDCNELSSLPMGMFQQVGSYQIPQSILNRIASIRANCPPPAGYLDPNIFKIQAVTAATGGIVNCDYFTVHISQLPQLPNGAASTPDNFLEYFRKNINQFISSSVGVSFQPYVGVTSLGNVYLNDNNLFNSSFENSLGAVIHISMADDGSVIQSEYMRNQQTHTFRFKFTTMTTPKDGEHPVAGNREFGIFPDPSGGYCFYTMGVDRTWTASATLFNFIADGAFEGADALWTNILGNVKNFVNSHSGNGNFYNPQYRTFRPKWDALQAFLKGTITLQQLKALNHCP